MIRLIVDSTCDLPGDMLEEHGIITVPLMITIGDAEYRDKVDIQPGEVYDAMRNGIAPKTSQINLDCLSGTYESLCKQGCDFIYLAFSSSLSCTCHSADVLMEDFKVKYPTLRMAVVDSRGGSMATGLIALQAARLIEQGCGFDEVLDSIREMAEHVEHLFTIMDLKWLIKGGRIDPIAGTIGSLLGVKPIIQVKKGTMSVLKKVRGRENAISALCDIVAERIKEFPEQLVGIAHSGSSAAAAALQKTLEKKFKAAGFMIGEIGSALAVHIGVGALGVFFFNKKFKFYVG